MRQAWKLILGRINQTSWGSYSHWSLYSITLNPMRHFIFLILTFFFSTFLQAQNLKDGYLSSKLVSGYPSEVSWMAENLSNVKCASLKTGIDSMKVFFGSNVQDSSKSFWASLGYQGRNTFSMFNLQEMDSSSMLTKDVEFKFNEGSSKIVVKVIYDPASDEIFYQWMNENGKSETATVQKVDLPIEKNKPMPHFKVESIDGTPISIDDFKGKYLVINWWQTTCAPCIKEMPGLNEMVEKYQSNNDVEFIAIAWDEKEKLKKFLQKREFKYQQTLYNQEVASIFGNSFPKHIIVNPEGIVSFYFEGGYTEINSRIEQSLMSQMKD